MGSSNFELKLHYAMKVQKIIYKIFIFTIIFLVYNAKKIIIHTMHAQSTFKYANDCLLTKYLA